MKKEVATAGRILAVLGPTNTGKTHFAVERMLSHESGMIGFPLRLLAREVYDRVVALKGAAAVALRTGEEKLGSDQAAYTIATVEAMPMQRQVAFLGVDEIQLCADFERGHVFTDRLLHARGYHETMFLGSDTIRPALKRLVPAAEIITRPRFSTLTYAGHAKLNRLPRRSAVVAFSTADVYTLGEIVRRQKGGAAVVLGALSPRTRNAQVALYQSGEVDHLIATDAIGMGLNMDLAHVAFAGVHKFDGRHQRKLTPPEVAQIAGRAGRHMADGTFGTTNGCELLDEQLIEAVETHQFTSLKALRWRNSCLEFDSIEKLRLSLDAPPRHPGLIKVRDALDDRSLALLAQRPEIRSLAQGRERVQLLWQVCQIPDFRKMLTDAHLHLLSTVYRHLAGPRGRLPNEWVGKMIARLDQVAGDIDTLVQRLAHIRTWTYLSHRADWLVDAPHWQGIAHAVEDRLSDALHERLTQRFVDRRAAALMKGMREQGLVASAIEEEGLVTVDGHAVGRLEGLRFTLAASETDLGRKVLSAAARKAIEPELIRRAEAIRDAADTALALDGSDHIVWRGSPIARLCHGSHPRRPHIRLIASEEFSPRSVAIVEKRLGRWLEDWLTARLEPLEALAAAARSKAISGSARGVAFSLVEGLGSVERSVVAALVRQLTAEDHQALKRLGVRFGLSNLYVPALLKPAAIEARARLLRIAEKRQLAIPPTGRTSVREAVAADMALKLGFMSFGGFMVRQDVIERLSAGLRRLARQHRIFALPLELAGEAGVTRAELETIIEQLGYRRAALSGAQQPDRPAEHALPAFSAGPRQKERAPRPQDKGQTANAHSPFALLATLKGAS